MECYKVGQVRFKPFGWCEVNHDHRLEDVMKLGARDNAENKLPRMKGKLREGVGRVQGGT